MNKSQLVSNNFLKLARDEPSSIIIVSDLTS